MELLKLNGDSKPSIRIVIPQIQRDYVQGREDKKEIRQPFLSTIKSQMDTEKTLNIDLIYGFIRGKKDFIPLDGQQRLTTLFLLHWYLACHDGRHVDFANLFYAGEQAHFVYQTRPSATAFCETLCREGLDSNTIQGVVSEKGLSNLIRNAAFFRDYWYFDPTVQAMLAMLDAIHDLFSNTSNYYNRLTADTDGAPKAITFDYLDLDNLDKSDMLYIRMNDRGLSLSTFDTFKASLENYMQVTKHVGFTRFFNSIDGPWTNLLWLDEQPDTFDTAFMSVLSAFIINALAASTETTEKTIKNLFDIIVQKDISFYSYQEQGVFRVKTDETGALIIDSNTERDAKVITYLIQGMSFLDRFLQKDTHEIEPFKDYFDLKKEFIRIQYRTKSAEGTQRIRLYESKILLHALMRYCMTHENLSDLAHWMRIITNLVQSVAPYDDPGEYMRSMRAIDVLLAQWDQGVVQALKQVSSEFDQTQILEEIVKQTLIDQDYRWEELLRTAEIHPYFTGQIGFLLLLSGINIAQNIGEIDREEHTKLQLLFSEAWEKAKLLFTDKGLNPAIDQYRWERALLACGDYRLQVGKGNNFSLLINSDRDYSWKRFLKCHRANPEVWERQREIIKQIFQKISVEDIAGSLDKIIADHPTNDWRSCFIDNWKVLEYYKEKSGKRIMQEDTSHGMILIPKVRASSSHPEIYSYAFYCEHNENPATKFGIFGSPLQYHYVNGFPEPTEYPCAYLDGWKRETGTMYGLDIAFQNNTYLLRCFARDSLFEEEVKDVVCEDTTWLENMDWGGFVRPVNFLDELIPTIKDLSNRLSNAFGDLKRMDLSEVKEIQ